MHHARRLSPPLLLALACGVAPFVLAAAPATPPAARPTPPPPRFEESSQVVSVEVPVNIVGRDGRAVHGLQASDFTVYDEGRRQELRGFSVVDTTPGASPAADAGAAATPRPLPPQGRRHVLLLFDLSFASPTSVLRARLAARDFVLHGLQPQDLAAVATYSLEQGPRLVVTFTADRAQLARGIDTLGFHASSEIAGQADPLHFLVPTPASETTGAATGGLDSVRGEEDRRMYDYIQSLMQEAERSERHYDEARISAYTRGMAQVARVLASVPGRKQVIYFSEGFDSRLMVGNAPTTTEADEDAQNALFGEIWKVDSDTRWGNTGLQNQLFQMLEQFRRADCVVQSIDISGLRADTKEPGQKTLANGQESLFYMANETGGELYRNANDFGSQIEAAMRRTDVTYVLTFERSDLPADGSYHRLKVEVKDLPLGARVSYRPGYYAPRPFQDLDPLEKNLMAGQGIAEAQPRHDVAVHVLAAPFRATPQRAYVPVVLEIDGPSLLVQQQGDTLDTEIYVYASDAHGEMKGFLTYRVRVDLTRARRILETTGLKYYGHLDLAPGDYRLRVLVRNGQTGRTGVESVPLTVPTYASAQPYLLPPLFMAGGEGWMMVRERPASADDTGVVYPFTVKGEPYVPAAYPVVPAAGKATICLVGYNLGEKLELQGTVRGRDGQPLSSGRVALVERTATGIAGLDKLIATFDAGDLHSGDYVLQVAVRDTASGKRQENSLPFTIR